MVVRLSQWAHRKNKTFPFLNTNTGRRPLRLYDRKDTEKGVVLGILFIWMGPSSVSMLRRVLHTATTMIMMRMVIKAHGIRPEI
ncbi:hypothetical protein E1B28_012330 [Marasmius oreades]|uniref:Uncharacterized protein n=1 Tax=Marasmius oreades TaxID=181124 RepID=A0A9P7UPT4_9AGAR|nr:uncharacterized protein E1B28_012330 [Marasmius oreades]KAG7088321.1 hypothetical protein E1B28_012330 [Marasmius oreades]